MYLKMPVENFVTNVDNVKQDTPEYVKEKIKTELSSLQKEMFYTIKDDGKVECHMDIVKSYLESIKGLEWEQIKEKWWAWVMAVQIALESMKDENWGSKYDVGVIDWMFWKGTRAAVLQFQKDNDLRFKNGQPDGLPGKVTIQKLLEKLGWIDGWGSWSNGNKGWPDKNPWNPWDWDKEGKDEWIDSENLNNVITGLWLTENVTLTQADKEAYWLPKGLKIYRREGKDGYYYNKWWEMVYVPNLDTNKNIKFCKYKLNIQNYIQTKRENWLQEYPPICNKWMHYLASKLISRESRLEQSAIMQRGGKYYVQSFGQEVPINLSTFTKWWIFDGNKRDLWKDIKMLDFSNYLVNRYKNTGNKAALWNSKFVFKGGHVIFTYDADKLVSSDYIRVENWKTWWRLPDCKTIIDPFEKAIWELTQSQWEKFCNYLNKKCGIE